MMTYFNQTRHDLNQENRYSINVEDHNLSGLYVDANEIWNETHQEISDKYNLPAFHITEDGYTAGDAHEDEAKELYHLIEGEDIGSDELMEFLSDEFIEEYKRKMQTAIQKAKSTEKYYA